MKVMIGLVRRDDMGHEEFAPFDGIAELWFDSAEAADVAYATDIGKAGAADSLAHVASRVRMPAEEYPIFG